MSMVGLELHDAEQLKLQNQLREILDSKQNEVTEVTEEPAVNRPSIQDRLREKVSECNGELDGMFDEFMLSGAKMTADFKPVTIMRGLNVAPQMISQILDNWKRKLAEFDAVVEGKDAQLVEAYSHLSKIQLRNIVKFCEAVINDCGAYVQIKKVERKPRKKKPVSAEKLTARFKYLREFAELKLQSEPVTRLVNAQEAWLYETKKRKLIYVVADTHAGSFTVKGSSLIGFDPTNSVQKTLRKPQEQIKALLQGGVAQHRKYFKDIRATEVKFNGRGSENLILLKIR
jgi:hypothetical protein